MYLQKRQTQAQEIGSGSRAGVGTSHWPRGFLTPWRGTARMGWGGGPLEHEAQGGGYTVKGAWMEGEREKLLAVIIRKQSTLVLFLLDVRSSKLLDD